MNTLRASITIMTALLMLSPIFATSAPGLSTVVHVEDASGEALPDVVVLLNPGEPYRSVAFLTNRHGEVTVSGLDCKPCLVTAMDPRNLFMSKTTEFNSSTQSVNLRLPVRPIIDRLSDPSAISVVLRVMGANGRPLRDAEIVLHDKSMTMEDNNFTLLKSSEKGLVNLKLPAGEYVVATSVAGSFLETTFQINPAARRDCSEKMTKCLISAAERARFGAVIAVHFSGDGNGTQ